MMAACILLENWQVPDKINHLKHLHKSLDLITKIRTDFAGNTFYMFQLAQVIIFVFGGHGVCMCGYRVGGWVRGGVGVCVGGVGECVCGSKNVLFMCPLSE